MAKLVLLIETYYPLGKHKINIHVSECIDCDSLRVKRYKDSKSYRDNLVIPRNSIFGPDGQSSDHSPNLDSSTDLVTIDDEFEDFSMQVADLHSEISGLSAGLQMYHTNTSWNVSFRDQFPCLFCDRSFF